MKRVNIRYYHGHRQLSCFDKNKDMHLKASNLLRKINHSEWINQHEYDQELFKFIDIWRKRRLESEEIYRNYDDFLSRPNEWNNRLLHYYS